MRWNRLTNKKVKRVTGKVVNVINQEKKLIINLAKGCEVRKLVMNDDDFMSNRLKIGATIVFDEYGKSKILLKMVSFGI